MRILFFMAAIAAVLGGGVFLYWNANPSAFIVGSRVPPGPRVPTVNLREPPAEACSAEDANYSYRADGNVTLRLEQTPEGPIRATGADVNDYTNVGSLVFVVSGYDREFRFVAAQSKGMTMSYLFPMSGERSVTVPRGVDLLQVSAFNTNYAYYTGLPALDHAAPAHIIVPNLSRYFYDHGGEPRIEEPPAFFDFMRCDKPPTIRSITTQQPSR